MTRRTSEALHTEPYTEPYTDLYLTLPLVGGSSIECGTTYGDKPGDCQTELPYISATAEVSRGFQDPYTDPYTERI